MLEYAASDKGLVAPVIKESEKKSIYHFLETPDEEAVETVSPDWKVETAEGFAPLYGDGLGRYLFEDCFYEWTQSQIDDATDGVL